MHLLRTAATLAGLATSVIGTPHHYNTSLDPFASTHKHLNTTSVITDQRKAFGEDFLKAVATFILINPEAEFPEGTDIMTAPLIQAINATINSILNPVPMNFTGLYTNETEAKVVPRAGNPSAWEYSGGRRKPPCPGWPVKQKYNATHWREWTFLHGYIYGPLDPRCELSNGHP